MSEAAAGKLDLEAESAPAESVDSPAAASKQSTGLSTFRSLRYRDYRLLWIGTLFTSSGQWIQNTTVSWLVYQLTGSGFWLGAVNGFRSLPLLVLGPLGGVAADRVDRKGLMLWTQVFLLVTSLIMASIIMSGQLRVWHLFAFTSLTGVAWAFNNPVRQTVVPNLVPKEDLMNALALSSTGFNITRILGPVVGGAMIALVGSGENFLLQAVAYAGVTLMVAMMVVPPRQRSNQESVRNDLAEGARFILASPTLRTQMALALVPFVVALPFGTLMPIFAQEVLGRGPTGFGLMTASVGVGAVVGTLTIASLTNIRHKGLVLLGAILGLGISIVLFSFSRSFPLSLLLLVVSGACQMTYMTTNQTLLQLSIPDAVRGRVMGIYMLNQGLLPFGSLFAGAFADATSAPTAVFFMGMATCLLALAFAAFAKDLRSA